MNKLIITKKIGPILLLAVTILFLAAVAVLAGTDTLSTGTYYCIRHGFKEKADCGVYTDYFPRTDYSSVTVGYSIRGHRHGTSEIRAAVCLYENGGGQCDWFQCTGSACGPEYGGQHPYNLYKSGSITITGDPNTPDTWNVNRYGMVEDAEVSIDINGTATYPSKGTISANPNPIQVCPPDTNGSTTISGSANTDWEIRLNSPTGTLWISSLQDSFSEPTGDWITNGMTFYLLEQETSAVLDTVTVNHTSTGCITHTLTVNSSGTSGVAITSSNATYSGTTNYSKSGIANNTTFSLTAPSTSGGRNFSDWTGCNSVSGTTCNVTMIDDRTVTANYEATNTHTLTVNSSGTSGVAITSSNATYSGTTNYSKSGIANNTTFSLTAPWVSDEANFLSWSGCSSASGTICNVTITANRVVTANYEAPATYSLTVNSSGASGVAITSTDANYAGTTNYSRTGIAYNTTFSLTAPSTSGGRNFSSWTGCSFFTGTTCSVTMTGSQTVTANYATPTLFVDLTAATDSSTWQNSLSGSAPLNGIDLRAVVTGTATGTINYTFYCNRSDSGTNITLGWDAKFDSVNTNPETVNDLCNYSSPGTYTAKVIVERGTALPDEERLTITLTNTPPTASNVTVAQPNYCFFGPSRSIISWSYSDPDGNPQSAYQVQIIRVSDGAVIYDSGKQASNTASHAVSPPGIFPPGTLSYATTYRAQVWVWDSTDSQSSPANSPSWATPAHAYPDVDFSWSPFNPSVNQTVQFIDETVFSDGSSDASRQWLWNFGDGATSTLKNPTHTYGAENIFNVVLTATDASGFQCNSGILVGASGVIPIWIEVAPKK
ncbi:MAG: PKD domain-containing protein [bacterium]|nr:PKD domain-containing protein [bacterium]